MFGIFKKKRGGFMEKPEYRVRVEDALDRLESGDVKIRDFRSACEEAVDHQMTTGEVLRLQRIINGKGFVHPSVPIIVWFSE